MGSDSESICFIIPIFLLYLNSFSDYRKNIYSILLKEKEESWEIDLDRLIVSDVVLGEVQLFKCQFYQATLMVIRVSCKGRLQFLKFRK